MKLTALLIATFTIANCAMAQMDLPPSGGNTRAMVSEEAGITSITIKYSRPILQANYTPCHFPPHGRKAPLNTYDDAKTYITSIIDRVKLSVADNKFMPFRSKKPPLNDRLINI